MDRTLDFGSPIQDFGSPMKERTLRSRNHSRDKLESIQRRSPSLEWTHAPHTKVEEVGGVRCQVSVPALAGTRFHKPHLKQTFRLEPNGQARPPPLPPRHEQIVVKEADLRRFGNDLKALRECQVQPKSLEGVEENKVFNVSFKSAFAQRCRADADLRDPWLGMKNPEFSREQNESDLVLNQVWVNAMPARKKEVIPVVEEEAPDELYASPEEAKRELMRASTTDVGIVERMSSSRSSRSCRRERRRGERTIRPASVDRPPAVKRSGSRTGKVQQQESAPSRIQPLESVLGDELDDVDNYRGSQAVRAAAKAQRAGLRQLSDQTHYDAVPRSAWLSLDTQSGEVMFYQKAAAERLESAYRSGRASVPLAGLGKEIDGCIVAFARGDENGKIVETTLKGRQREVQRVAVPAAMTEVRLNIMREDGRWIVVSDKVKQELMQQAEDAGQKQPKIEERKVYLSGAEVVTAPAKLPPVNRNQRTYFINQGVTEYW